MPEPKLDLNQARREVAEASMERLAAIARNKNQHWAMRLAALELLAGIEDSEAIETINWVIQSEDKHIRLREAAIHSVSEKKRSSAIGALVVALNTGSKHIRCLAASALGDRRYRRPTSC